MPRQPGSPRPARSRAVREPVQVYLAPDDSALLNQLATDSGLSKAEILRRGMRSYAREHGGPSPMLRFLADGDRAEWPDRVAVDHDAVLGAIHRGTPPRKRR